MNNALDTMKVALERKDLLIAEVTQIVQQRQANAAQAEDTRKPTDHTAEFIGRLFEALTREDCQTARARGLATCALSLLDWFQERRAGDLSFRVFHPSEDENGWSADRTTIQIITDDSPFLLGSVHGELTRRDLAIHLVLHPQVSVRRDDDGRLLELLPRNMEADDAIRESVMHFEIDQITSLADLVDLETALRKVLGDVRAGVEDWQAMRAAAGRALAGLELAPKSLPQDMVEEAIEFKRWIADDHFTYLGYLEYKLVERDGERFLEPVRDSGLGLLRKVPLEEQARSRTPMLPATRRFIDSHRLISISKSRSKSPVHRNVHMDMVSVKRFSNRGDVVGEDRFIGLFTSLAYSITSSKIPLVRRKVARVIDRTGFLPASHDIKALRHIVENYPRDELFQISEDDLYRFALRILELQLRPRLALLVRWDEEERFVSCMVYLPRERHSTRLRMQIQEVLERAFSGTVTDFSIRLSERPLAQLQFIVETPGGRRDVEVAGVEKLLAEVVRSWSDRLKEPLGAEEGGERALKTWKRYKDAFPNGYQDRFQPNEAAHDIELIEEVQTTGTLGMRLYRPHGASASRLHLRTFELAVPQPLSTVLPMLENMGLRVNSEIPFAVRPKHAPNPIWVRDFELMADDLEVDPPKARDRFQEAFSRIWSGEVENDLFNQLILRADLEWREVIILRAYCKYLLQTGIAFSQRYMAQTLARNGEITRLLIALFGAYHNPARQEPEDGVPPEERKQELRGRLLQLIDKVTSSDEDRILHYFLNLIRSTLRTNYFQTGADGEPKDYLSFKLDGMKVRKLPDPRPAFEIFVYSPRVEAVHLRSGQVARGGIRWSDRREDFRTEILGLVKSQIVKNAVIVPEGAKGGFVVKRPPTSGEREDILAEGVACYQTMIRGMLDITDNLEGETVVPPADTVRLDGDDPYLVVAADKGTATFSDIANAVAAEYDFWLGDAFASGGSVGYDHKKMGITARGAWESVKRHFREMGHDTQQEPFTVVGVGDMSGDVFGNGMLLSEQIRLVGAFNHLHIFIDPDPDPATSFAERQRLFELPRSTWDDYDTGLLSEGGGVFKRQAKEVTVSQRIKELLGLPETTLPPADLIRALLSAKIDLLWFGGIGTYIKGSHQSSAEVGDWANDDVRVDAKDLKCRVIGEGANLGVTQQGRIEFALAGGRLNTDFIDNSGGVDCSDHEVNIKIALADAVQVGDLTPESRDPLLADMTDEVAELVLRDNYLQTLAISLTAHQGVEVLGEHMRLMRQLEHAGILDRRLEGLPDEATLQDRREQKQGLTRPELSVLLAYSKIKVYRELLDSRLPDDILLQQDLVRYFPQPMQWNHRGVIERHRLKREIIATHVTNSIINRVGPTFVTRLAEETGSKVSDIARAYASVREIFDIRTLWQDIEALDNHLSADLQIKLFLETVQMMERSIRWFLRYAGRPLNVSKCVARYETDIITVAAQIEDLLPPKERQRVKRKLKRLLDYGIPDGLAGRLSCVDVLPSACDVVRCAQESNIPVEHVGRVYFALGERLGFDRLRRSAAQITVLSSWQQTAVTAIVGDLYSHQTELAQQIVQRAEDASTKPKAVLDAWVQSRRDDVERISNMLSDFDNAPRIDFVMFTVAERELRRLVETGRSEG